MSLPRRVDWLDKIEIFKLIFPNPNFERRYFRNEWPNKLRQQLSVHFLTESIQLTFHMTMLNFSVGLSKQKRELN